MSIKISSQTPNQLSLENTLKKEIRQTIKDRFRQKNTGQKFLIAIQGSSSSGKSTIAENIYRMMKSNKVEVFMLSLDCYYKTYKHTDLREYDFDNPGALDWEKIDGVLNAIDNDEEFIPTYSYSFITKKCDGPIYIKNNRPSVVIIEGIYAFNPINEYQFNIEKFDPLQTAKKINDEFVRNTKKYTFRMLKVKLSMCKSKSLEVRIERDVKQRNKPKEESLLQFENQVWPATQKWVNNDIFMEDLKIVHGSFNEDVVIVLIEELANYFIEKKVRIDGLYCDSNLKHCFSVHCSGECRDVNEK